MPNDNTFQPKPDDLTRRDRPMLLRYLSTQWRRAFGLNVSCIDDLLFVGGEFRREHWRRLYTMGIRAVVNLQAEREDEFEHPHPDRTLHLPVIDFHPPTLDQLHEAVAFITDAHAAQLPVLIHCHAGVGRASLTASAYLVAQGLDYVSAFSKIKQARPIVALNSAQRARLVEWEQLIRSKAPQT